MSGALIFLVGLLLLVVWGISVFDIVRRHLGRQRTAAWLLIVILLPFVGSILYWVMRKPTDAEIRAAGASIATVIARMSGTSSPGSMSTP
jgi:hypothetical protein